MNRTNNTDAIETGGSAGYGIEYINNKTKTNSIEKLYSSKLSFGQVIRKNRQDSLPSKSSLNNETSDFVGDFDLSIFGKKLKNIKVTILIN